MSDVTWVDVVGLIVSIITMVAIALAAIQIRYQSKQIHRELESLYVQRYWELMDKRSDQFVRLRRPEASDRLVIHQYLQLCEDEIDLRRLGRVTDETWGFWADSITSQCSSSGYREAVEALEPDELPSLRGLLRTGMSADPLDARSRWWHLRHGL